MDGYPEHLAPEFDQSGAVKTPFGEWWRRVQRDFPTVPENVAEHWLHEHWGHSPNGHIVSRNYCFELEKWESSRLWDVRSIWCDFDSQNVECIRHGAGLADMAAPPYGYRTAIYMLANGDFPAPIVVLDNRDGHLPSDALEPWNDRPSGYVLMEGHRRFNLGLHLQKIGRLQPAVTVWVMKFCPR